MYFEIGQTIIKVQCSSKSGSGRHSMILPAKRASVIHRNIRVFMKFHNAFFVSGETASYETKKQSYDFVVLNISIISAFRKHGILYLERYLCVMRYFMLI